MVLLLKTKAMRVFCHGHLQCQVDVTDVIIIQSNKYQDMVDMVIVYEVTDFVK